MRRLQLRKGALAIQTEPKHRYYLESLRILRPDLFKGGRISEVLQLAPSKLETGVVYNVWTGEILGEPWKV